MNQGDVDAKKSDAEVETAQDSESTTQGRIKRLLTGEQTDDDILDLSRRLGTIIADVGAEQLLTSDDRRRLAAELTPAYFKALRAVLADETPFNQSFPVLFMPWAYPEAVFPLGYDEIRYAEHPIEDPTVSESLAGVLKDWENDLLEAPEPEFEGLSTLTPVKLAQLVQYRSPDGVWHDYEGLMDRVMPEEDERNEQEWMNLILSSWLHGLQNPRTASENVLSLPALHLPSNFGDSLLHSYTKALMRELQNNSKSIHELHWRTLEEIVAELLFDLGLDVTLTDRSNDGGRDVIARGELIPGEPTLLAVEVKHRPIVPVSELRQAMWANRHFPALLFVTSGRFSAGVYKERQQNDGMLRLYLKDGAGLSQWISSYVRRNFES